MHPDGTYERLRSRTPYRAFSAHGYFMSNPSLSGRGSALEVSLPPRLTLPEGQK